jgi:hypothetical protein
VRREDLLKPDVMSQAILLGAAVLVCSILVLIVFFYLTQTLNPV